MNRKPSEVLEEAARSSGPLAPTLVFSKRRAMHSRRAFRAPRVGLQWWARLPRERTTRSAFCPRTRPRRDVRCRFPLTADR
jgi:hypothetical protein